MLFITFFKDQKMFTVVQELMKTRRELREVKEQLQSAVGYF
jgi:hypothetical protein